MFYQKFKLSTRRLKRLNSAADTPSPSKTSRRKGARKSAKKATPKRRNEIKMYTPFNIDTPSKTPTRIRTVSSLSNQR